MNYGDRSKFTEAIYLVLGEVYCRESHLWRWAEGSFKCLPEYSSAHLWWEAPQARERIIRNQQGKFPKVTYGLEEVTFSSSRGKRCSNTWGISCNTQKVIFTLLFFSKNVYNWYSTFLNCTRKFTNATVCDQCLGFSFRKGFWCYLLEFKGP